jgi:hypothetical protein
VVRAVYLFLGLVLAGLGARARHVPALAAVVAGNVIGRYKVAVPASIEVPVPATAAFSLAVPVPPTPTPVPAAAAAAAAASSAPLWLHLQCCEGKTIRGTSCTMM